MDFAQQQRDPRRHVAGITTVVFLHAIAIYALTTGLARKVVDVLKKPLEVNIIEEIKDIPPPPPPKVLPPPRHVVETAAGVCARRRKFRCRQRRCSRLLRLPPQRPHRRSLRSLPLR
ncbi:MAG: hypothetical protein WDM70_00715 [Nitrosomonadales bacterium]